MKIGGRKEMHRGVIESEYDKTTLLGCVNITMKPIILYNIH